MPKKPASPRTPDETPARKRAKRESPEPDDVKGRKPRGRPRIDSNDASAAERRRTQIRLAQRAYRNRKENVIQTLESQIQDLRDANKEMASAFMLLRGLAESRGVLDRIPDLARQFQATADRFVALSRTPSDESSRDGQSNSPEQESGSQVEGTLSTGTESAGDQPVPRPHIDRARQEVVDFPTTTQPQQLFGGIIVTHEPVTRADLVPANLSLPYSLNSRRAGVPLAPEHEVVTQPTLDNASFPFGTTFPLPAPPSSSPSAATTFTFGNFTTRPSPFETLPMPESFACQEATFARRLHRTALERGLRLISMENPPQRRLARVFGFCMLFEPKDVIRARLEATIRRNAAQPLHYWQHPFLQLGGAGTHLPKLLPGGTSADQTGMPLHHNGFSMGPFDAAVVGTRDRFLDPVTHRMKAPGYEGEFYDCEEVQAYLHQRGVDFPPGADSVTVEVDPAAFTADVVDTDDETAVAAPPPVSNPLVRAPAAISSGPFGAISSALANGLPLGLDTVTSAMSAGSLPRGSLSSTTLSSRASNSDETAVTVPDLGVFDQWVPNGSYGDVSAGVVSGGAESPRSQRKIVTLDVNVLVFELVERCTCLGRTPGFRPAEVNTAFWIAANAS